jgi:hypothetical protein
MRIIIIISAGVVTAAPALAQGESTLGAEFRIEGDALQDGCKGLKTFVSCASTLDTDNPVHVAIGSIAPQNGFAFGPAITAERPIGENWRFSWSGDVVGATGGAWRAGAYLKMVRTGVRLPAPVGPGAGSDASEGISPYPVFNIYAQNISLPTVSYFGLGPNTTLSMKSILTCGSDRGNQRDLPHRRLGRLNLSLVGEANGRFVDVGGDTDKGPSIDQLYTPVTAPGLLAQPGFAQFGEGVRVMPRLANGRVRLNYLGTFQQFLAASDSTFSFRRWTLDLSNEVALYKTVAPSLTRDTNDPNQCGVTAGDLRCPPMIPPAASRNYTGSIGFRLFASASGVSSRECGPVLLSADDRRIRHQRQPRPAQLRRLSLPRSEAARAAGELRALHLQDTGRHLAVRRTGPGGAPARELELRQPGSSYTFGLTLRAGGFPAVVASWSTGSTEGHHFAFTISTSLLGGSSRPSLRSAPVAAELKLET